MSALHHNLSETQCPFPNLCAIWDSRLFDRRPAFALYRTPRSNPPSTIDDPTHELISDLIRFNSIIYVTVSQSSNSGLFRNPFSYSGQRILSINLDMSLSCLISFNSSTVSQFLKTPVNRGAQN